MVDSRTTWAVVALLLSIGACAPVVPPIADTGGDLAFKARIATGHPPGSRAAPLRAELARQGFAIAEAGDPPVVSAVFRTQNLPCYSVVRIEWREDRRGRIAAIRAARQACS